MDRQQPSVTDVEYGNRRRVSRREQFLETMDLEEAPNLVRADDETVHADYGYQGAAKRPVALIQATA